MTEKYSGTQTNDNAAYLVLESLSLSYGRSRAVHELDLAVPQGQLVSFLGPSGCGKTTTLRAVAGLLFPDAGHIRLAGRDITHTPTHSRDIGLVFQSYALFPHLSVFENVAFGLRLRKVSAPEITQRVKQALASVGLSGLDERLPTQLSGGQQQRVAVARAIVIRPRLLLLDEPLSNLDARLRVEMRAELRRMQRELGITMLYVTHDQEEALSLSDRIVILREGRVEQDATPADVYHHPRTPFVARFMGWNNLFVWRDGALHGNDEGRGSLPMLLPVPAGAPKDRTSSPSHMAWRAEHVKVLPAHQTSLPGRVLARSYLGERIEFLVDTALGSLRASSDLLAPWQEGDIVSVMLDPARAALI